MIAQVLADAGAVDQHLDPERARARPPGRCRKAAAIAATERRLPTGSPRASRDIRSPAPCGDRRRRSRACPRTARARPASRSRPSGSLDCDRVEKGGRRAFALAVPDGPHHVADAFLVGLVDVLATGSPIATPAAIIASSSGLRPGCRLTRSGPPAPSPCDGVVFHFTIAAADLVPAPAGAALRRPIVEILRLATRIMHAVQRAGPAEHHSARPGFRPDPAVAAGVVWNWRT